MRVVTVVGARPQFIKAAPMCRALRQAGHEEFLVHTGQHYDPEMSRFFFEELDIPPPDVNLDVGSGSHAQQTGRMMTGVEEALLARKPDAVVLYGDTNSTLAGALAAAKLPVPIAHVEAGLRSFDRSMPEEINRVVTDRLSSLLWAPGRTAVENLRREGLTAGVELVGDIMVDALQAAVARSGGDGVLSRLGLRRRGYLVATIHRAANAEAAPLRSIVTALGRQLELVIWPLHPRMRARLEALGLQLPPNVRTIPPLGHLEMIALVRHARLVLTDSGGLQKEAYWLEVPCVTLRDTTEWVETVAAGWNTLVGSDTEKIVEAVGRAAPGPDHPVLYGDGQTAARCVASLERACDRWAAGRNR
jgi:UDP-GlcNAc3NAcA epimerase